MGSRAGLNALEKRKLLTLPLMEFRSLGRPAHSRYTDCGTFRTSKGLQRGQVLLSPFPFSPSPSKKTPTVHFVTSQRPPP
jgi:hypothetical protein